MFQGTAALPENNQKKSSVPIRQDSKQLKNIKMQEPTNDKSTHKDKAESTTKLKQSVSGESVRTK